MLASIAAYQDAQWKGKGPRWGKASAWCIVRQREIIAWYQRFLRRFGRPDAAIAMCRRTLNYQLAGLERDGFLDREQRHTGVPGSRKLELRPTIYKFPTLARQWIRRRAGWVANPLDHLAVQKIAQSGFNSELNSSTSLFSAVDKTIHSEGTKKRAALRRRTSSSARGAARAPGKPLSREGTRPARSTLRKRAARAVRRKRARR